MSKRGILLPVLLVVAGIGVGIGLYFFWLSSPVAQAWVSHWLSTANDLTLLATLLADIVAFIAVIIVLIGLRQERKRARAEREQAEQRFREERRRVRVEREEAQRRFWEEQARAREALEDERRRFLEAQAESRRQFFVAQRQIREAYEEGRKQFLEVQYAQYRPLLVPLFADRGEPPITIDWTTEDKLMRVQNVGTGVATNIWGVFMPPTQHGTTPQYSKHFPVPIDAGESLSSAVPYAQYFTRGDTTFDGDDKIAEYPLCVPEEHAPAQHSNHSARKDRCIARLTLTYHDIFGRKHASIFDLTQTGGWVEIAVIPNIAHDLGDLHEAKGSTATAEQVKTHIES